MANKLQSKKRNQVREAYLKGMSPRDEGLSPRPPINKSPHLKDRMNHSVLKYEFLEELFELDNRGGGTIALKRRQTNAIARDIGIQGPLDSLRLPCAAEQWLYTDASIYKALKPQISIMLAAP